MSDMKVENDQSSASFIFLPPPKTGGKGDDVGATQAGGASRAETAALGATTQSTISSVTPQTGTSVSTLIKTGDASNPSPTVPGPAGEMKANLANNPWFAANPIVAISMSIMSIATVTRESNMAMSRLTLNQMQGAMSLAQAAAQMTLASAAAESNKEKADGMNFMAQAIVGFVTVAASFLATSSAGKQADEEIADAAKAAKKAGGDVDAAKVNVGNATKNLSKAETKVKPATTDLDQATSVRDPAAKAASKSKKNLEQAQTKLDNVNRGVATAKADLAIQEDKLTQANISFKAKQKTAASLEANRGSSVTAKIQVKVQILNSVQQAINGITGSITSFYKAEQTLIAGQAQANGQIIQGLQSINQTLSDKINSSAQLDQQMIDSLYATLTDIWKTTMQSNRLANS